jgi:hypothetical protein
MATARARAVALVAGLALTAAAVGARRPDPWKTTEVNSTWQTECGACHLAFPPDLLPATDWRRLLSSLDQHFGVDARLEDPVRDEITGFLSRNSGAGSSDTGHLELPRITTTERFLSKHQGAIRLWMRAKVDRLSNCVACHPQAGP